MRTVRNWLNEQAGALLWVATVSAVLLVLAYIASKLADDILTEDPTGYRLLTLCGLAAIAALAVGAFREEGWGAAIAALVAAAVFGFAAYACVRHWLWATGQAPTLYKFQPSPLLPFFALVSTIGLVSSLALIVALWRRPDPVVT